MNDGLLKEKKKPVQFFQISLEGGNLLGKVNVIIEHAKIAELTRRKRLVTREEVLRKEFA